MESPPDDDEQSYYAILNVPKTAALEDIKKAYRSLAQTLHPDKHVSSDFKTQAEEAFSKLQQAYEVLSDPVKRQVYDVYGKQGLVAGLEVGDHLKSVDALRNEWKKFKEQQRQRQQDAAVSHRGYYMVKLHLSDIWDKLTHGSDSRAPSYRAIMVTNTLDLPLDELGWFSVQGQVALRGTTGVGSFVCGYRRMVSSRDSFEAQAVMGLKSLFSVTTTRQISSHDSARLTTTYNAQDGVGMEFGLVRQLYETSTGSFTWTLGPKAVTGMALLLTHRQSKWIFTGKIDVGSSTGITAKASYILNDTVSVRFGGKLATTNVELELGTNFRYSSKSSFYLGTAVGLQGILVRGRYNRMGHVYDVPVLVTSYWRDPWTLLAASTLPTITYIVVSRYVLRPLSKWSEQRALRKSADEQLQELKQAVLKSLQELELLQPVATRKAAAELQKNGLIILEAVYGELASYYSTCRYIVPGVLIDRLRSTIHTSFPSPMSWLDVTSAVQYLVSDSKLALHEGVPKSGLMGFCNFGGHTEKALFVAYMWQGKVYEVEIGNIAGLSLPEAGEEVTSVEKIQYYKSKAVRFGGLDLQ